MSYPIRLLTLSLGNAVATFHVQKEGKQILMCKMCSAEDCIIVPNFGLLLFQIIYPCLLPCGLESIPGGSTYFLVPRFGSMYDFSDQLNVSENLSCHCQQKLEDPLLVSTSSLDPLS